MKSSNNSSHWSIVNILDEYPSHIPVITNFGGGIVDSTNYRHQGSQRSDHPHYLFQFTVKGKCCLDIGKEHYEITAGQGFLCNTHQKDLCYYYPADADENYEMLFWCFYGADPILGQLLEKNGPIFQIPPHSQSLAYIKKFSSVLHLTKTRTASFAECSEMAMFLINDLIQTLRVETKTHPLVAKAREIVEKSPWLRHSVENVAKELGVTRVHFNRVFKKETGISPKKFIDKTRMEHAELLLKNSSKSIKEISNYMNYDTPAHFIRSFKNVAGVTPGEYRRN